MSSLRERALEGAVKRLEQENKLLREKKDLLVRRLHKIFSEDDSSAEGGLSRGRGKEPGKPAGDKDEFRLLTVAVGGEGWSREEMYGDDAR